MVPMSDTPGPVWEPMLATEHESVSQRVHSLVNGVARVLADAVDQAISDNETEDWSDELAELTADEHRPCYGQGCQACGWMGYTGPETLEMPPPHDEAILGGRY